jgi:hypothetical protein
VRRGEGHLETVEVANAVTGVRRVSTEVEVLPVSRRRSDS